MEPSIISDTIAAVSTPPGVGGIAVIRVSGPEAFSVVNEAWQGSDLKNMKSHSAHLGKYVNVKGELLDEALVTIFRKPASFTGEDVVEISVHGSTFVQREVLSDLIKRGARIAAPGEFTQRAFLNGKMDLAQAEGVADLIASSSKAAHDLAINQTKGSFSKEFDALRDKLIEFASLLELELDFSEEDVEFADRSNLISLCREILEKVDKLAASYANGAVIKNGVPVVIAGVPNAGKSSLLNLLTDDEKAIVTDIPGTTRDLIEATSEFDGISYRFIDTAGLRDTDDTVEAIGVGRARDAMSKAYIVIWIIDPTQDLSHQLQRLQGFRKEYPDKNIITLLNKSDVIYDGASEVMREDKLSPETGLTDAISFSTVSNEGHKKLLNRMKEMATNGLDTETDIIVTNARHYESLRNASRSLRATLQSLESGISADLIAQDIREAITHLSLITGTISSTTLLHSIFSRFCIGK